MCYNIGLFCLKASLDKFWSNFCLIFGPVWVKVFIVLAKTCIFTVFLIVENAVL